MDPGLQNASAGLVGSAIADRVSCIGNSAPKNFNAFLREVEGAVRPRWHYCGNVDLLLFNARRDQVEGVNLDLSTLLVLAVQDKAIRSASELFEAIIHYAPQQQSDNPAWGFSEAMARDVGAQWLTEVIQKLVPAAQEQRLSEDGIMSRM